MCYCDGYEWNAAGCPPVALNDVLTANVKTGVKRVGHRGEQGGWYDSATGAAIEVTHWAQLPELPDDDKTFQAWWHGAPTWLKESDSPFVCAREGWRQALRVLDARRSRQPVSVTEEGLYWDDCPRCHLRFSFDCVEGVTCPNCGNRL